jgi:serine/threonine protein kinase
VWLATDTGLNAERALKLIPPDKVLNPQNFFHEAQILKAVEHPNVVRVEETGTMADGRIYVAMEYLPKGSLEDEAKGAYVDLTRAKRIMIDMLRGLDHAHKQSVLHRDIKPANILIGSNNEGKLSDFGLAIPAGLNLKALGAKDYAYTLHVAPEIHRGHSHSILSDIYACGVTLYRLVNGDTYLPAVSPAKVQDLAVQGKLPDRSHYREFVPRPLRAIINRALHLDSAKRFTSAEDMRRSLERLTLQKNWRQRSFPHGIEWTCSWDNRYYEIRRERSPSQKWNVTVRRGATKKTARRITTLCAQALTRAQAEQRTRRILQDFVLGRL